jgi:long-chain fatty acid transport protein
VPSADQPLDPSARRGVTAVVLLMLAAPAAAGPLDDPHIGGIGFGGPTTGDLTAVFWNPAALGLLQGTEITVVASEQLVLSSIQRAPIDDAGQPGGTRTFPAVTGRGRRSSLRWPPGPGTFIAAGTAIGNRFSLAVALYTPYSQRTTFAATADGQEPTRYHLVQADLRNVALVPALAFRIGNEVRFGAAPGFLFSSGRLVFDEDTTLGSPCAAPPCAENPAAAARYDVGSGEDPFTASVSFTLAAGLHFRRGRFQAGLSFSSSPLGSTGGGVAIEADRTDIRPPTALGLPGPLCPGGRVPPCMFGRIGYDLPAVLTAGVSWQATATLAVTGIVRWMTFSRHGRIDVRVLTGASSGLRTAGLPESITLYRGFTDVIEGRLRLERTLGSWVRLGAAIRADTGSVPVSHVSPASVGGTPTIEPALMVEVRRPSWLRLTAGYALAITPAVTNDRSVFDPTAARACTEAGGDLTTEACIKRLAGAARPTAAGRYSALGHSASLNATFVF